MGRAKEIVMKVIPAKVATPFMKAHHYSGKVVNNSTLHFGVFLDGQLHGVMSYGPSLDKSKIIGLVKDTGWNEFLELNRMAFDSYLPRNSESRSISMSIKLIKKYAPQIKWIISFADACSCGDGTIYRASNFVLTGIKENLNLAELPDGTRVHKMTLASNPTSPRKELGGLTFFDVTGGTYNFNKYLDYVGATPIPGYQLRYIYFIDKAKRQDLTVPEIPFSKIGELGAGMEAGAKSVLFGDLSYYWVADRQGRSFRRLGELYAPTGQVGFLATQRVDGKLVLPEAVKVLQQKSGSAA